MVSMASLAGFRPSTVLPKDERGGICPFSGYYLLLREFGNEPKRGPRKGFSRGHEPGSLGTFQGGTFYDPFLPPL